MVVSYRRFGTIYQSHLQWILEPWRWERWVAPKRR